MKAFRSSGDPRIFFPWESRGGVLRWLRFGRLRKFLLVLGFFAFVGSVATRERQRAGIRRTQATLLDVRRALDTYLADHEGNCPASLAALNESGTIKVDSRDAWGRPLRLVCPAPRDGASYELMSDGPDGEPGGLDRIE
jgi:general secretion pathway protein G